MRRGLRLISTSNAARREIVVRTMEEGARVRCSVEDAGPGIPKESAARIFQRLVTTKAGRMGMGLPIARSIIKAHDGRLAADNDSSLGGARFSFVLPIAG
jgi:signal transduction histidine kinase